MIWWRQQRNHETSLTNKEIVKQVMNLINLIEVVKANHDLIKLFFKLKSCKNLCVNCKVKVVSTWQFWMNFRIKVMASGIPFLCYCKKEKKNPFTQRVN